MFCKTVLPAIRKAGADVSNESVDTFGKAEALGFKNPAVAIPDFKDGQPYFVAKDVAEALGFKRPTDAVRDTCPSRLNLSKREMQETCFGHASLFTGSANSVALIPESDLYRLVMRSNLPSAQAFQDWVCKTVLPAIRKDGAYVMGEEKVATGEMSGESKGKALEPY